MNRFFEEIFYVDEFYVWNNKKNGNIYSWFDKGSNSDSYIDAYAED